MARRASGARGHDHAHDLVDELVRVAFAVMAVLNRVGAENDLSLTQLRVFGILRGRRARMAQLADFLGLDKSTMTGLVGRAEKRGLLQREPGRADRRVVEVFLRPEGAALVERLDAEIRRSLAPLTRTLTAAERDRAQALLERILGAAEEA